MDETDVSNHHFTGAAFPKIFALGSPENNCSCPEEHLPITTKTKSSCYCMEITPVLPTANKNSCIISRYTQNSYTFIPPFLTEHSLGNTALVESEDISLNRYLTKRIIFVIFPVASYRQIHRDQHMHH